MSVQSLIGAHETAPTDVDNAPPRGRFIDEIGAGFAREQRRQSTRRIDADLGHLRVEASRPVTLVLDTSFCSTETRSGDEDFSAPVLHLEEHLLALHVGLLWTARYNIVTQ